MRTYSWNTYCPAGRRNKRGMHMPFYRKIVGERLYLSPFDPEDAESAVIWAEWMNDPVVAQNYGGPHNLATPSSAKKTFGEFTGCRFDIVLSDGDVRIGHISLHNIDHLNRNAFLGIVIGAAAHRSKGYGTEAVRLALGFGFRTLNLNNIALTVLANMPDAIACYKKLGFREGGRLREWAFRNGEYTDKLYMDILAREFTYDSCGDGKNQQE